MENTEPDAADLFNEQHTTAESIAIAQKLPMASQCPKCEKVFKNDTALRMHDIRKHQNRGWDTSHNFGKQSRAQMLAKKREYNRKWRLARGMKVRPAALKETPRMPRTPQQKHKTLAPIAAAPTPTPGLVTYCPRCGCNIKVVAAAIAFGDNHS
jgi:hypothetical protein